MIGEKNDKFNYANFLVIKSEAMKKAYSMAAKAARVDFPVLIYGETGVGKEIMARYIHDTSSRSQTGKFVTLNCAVIPDNLIESELFGHEKGAFTGATREKTGLIKTADKGTLFLDEIAEMSLNMQNKLLRILEYGEFNSLGSVKVERSDFRLICATNTDLKEIIRLNRFRTDLFHRINVLTIKIPSLRERIEAIPDLVNFFLEKLGYNDYKVSLDVMDILLSYYWPGNIRELRNVIESAIAVMDGDEKIMQTEHMPIDIFTNQSESYDQEMSLRSRERRYRRKLIEYAMTVYSGDYKKVMKVLKVSKDVIYRSLAESRAKN
ncbi:MAG: sigma-54 dependent transcriptional regulator [Calditrichota bacterium]|jgi:transcriptional regulator with PAS, ATPase and Fis domain